MALKTRVYYPIPDIVLSVALIINLAADWNILFTYVMLQYPDVFIRYFNNKSIIMIG